MGIHSSITNILNFADRSNQVGLSFQPSIANGGDKSMVFRRMNFHGKVFRAMVENQVPWIMVSDQVGKRPDLFPLISKSEEEGYEVRDITGFATGVFIDIAKTLMKSLNFTIFNRKVQFFCFKLLHRPSQEAILFPYRDLMVNGGHTLVYQDLMEQNTNGLV